MRKGIRILLVDDHEVVRDGLHSMLRQEEDMEVIGQSANSEEALSQVETLSPNILLMDIKMPGVDGIELTRQIKQKHPSCNVIMLTLYDEYLTQAIEAGAVGYLLKDIKREELAQAIRQVHRGEVVISRSITPKTGMEYGERHGEKVEEGSDTVFEDTIQALAVTVEMRDPYTAGHQRRVTHLATTIAKETGLSEDQISGLRSAGLIHDIGKTRIPSEILTNPYKLSEAEFSIIKTHPLVGYEVLKNIEFPWPIAEIVHQHHERLDGSGYPRGLSGDDIILESRILMVADVVEAMSSHRPYRPALGLDRALLEVSEKRGILYDAKAVDACLKLCSEKEFKFG